MPATQVARLATRTAFVENIVESAKVVDSGIYRQAAL
jgi:hypothetical protein